ncbi:hypothetical protein FNV43_RR15778 [Rhamnella rubrinervis]|uniref:F-box domain-containing protein n=1 Tax=Rhamnella rubrinervis TaxID=2594499 RepID=A0A8K0E775_9ROSA|nr:hypothetical protein FNV43_RR15778 [Rhamnella rubrinervis]
MGRKRKRERGGERQSALGDQRVDFELKVGGDTESVKVLVTSTKKTASTWIQEVRSRFENNDNLTVGIDCHFDTLGRLATIEIGVSFSCLIYQFCHNPDLPSGVFGFLQDRDITFVTTRKKKKLMKAINHKLGVDQFECIQANKLVVKEGDEPERPWKLVAASRFQMDPPPRSKKNADWTSKELSEQQIKHSAKTQQDDACGNLKLEDLPDEIIVHILSLLPLKDAAATSILSSRWRYFWRFTRLMSLDFDFDLTHNHGSYRKFFDVRYYTCNVRKSYIDWVNTVVDQHLGGIKSLRVCFSLLHEHRIHVDKWIKFAMTSKSLERLELDFSVLAGSFTRHYRFFHELFSANFVGFKSLKVIYLKSVSVNGKDVEYFLSNAPLLERLTVHDSPDLVRLRVSGQSLALKYLAIMACWKLKSVEIYEVNIVSLYFLGRIKASNFTLRNVPFLVELFVGFCFCSSNFKRLFSSCLSQIEVLRMTDYFRLKKNFYRRYPVLPNVKQLHLRLFCNEFRVDGGLGNLRFIIEAFPNLEKLVLHVPYYLPPWKEDFTLRYEKVPKCPHYRLKEVEILEYSSKYGDIDRVLYLIKNTVGLQRIVINCKYNHTLRIMKTKQQLLEDEEVSRRHALTQLQPQVPSNIQFVCL